MTCKLSIGVTIDQESEKGRKKALDACFQLIENSVPSTGARVCITIDGLAPKTSPGLTSLFDKLGWIKH